MSLDPKDSHLLPRKYEQLCFELERIHDSLWTDDWRFAYGVECLAALHKWPLFGKTTYVPPVLEIDPMEYRVVYEVLSLLTLAMCRGKGELNQIHVEIGRNLTKWMIFNMSYENFHLMVDPMVAIVSFWEACAPKLQACETEVYTPGFNMQSFVACFNHIEKYMTDANMRHLIPSYVSGVTRLLDIVCEYPDIGSLGISAQDIKDNTMKKWACTMKPWKTDQTYRLPHLVDM